MPTTADLHIDCTRTLPTPQELKRELPLSARASETIASARKTVTDLVHGRDDRLLVVVGPCSIHDPQAALIYAEQLARRMAQHARELFVCMRVYFEKPRTALGWKGLINDPHLDGSCDVQHGLRVARSLLVTLAERGIPAATEALDPVVPQYLADTWTWAAIGARTTESPTHRELASGLSTPVGFKNGMDGSLDVAINAMLAARAGHSFLGIDEQGRASVVRTRGNGDSHVVLRGGRRGPNYQEPALRAASDALNKARLNPRVLIDCSHENSQKDHAKQPVVARSVAAQLSRGDSSVLGVMLESQLVAGQQKLVAGAPLVFGQSITDACIDMATTAELLDELARAVRARRHARATTTSVPA
jgi:3-deoxy-7-phosphoheptulonate synthase